MNHNHQKTGILIKKSFRCCALSLPIDGSQDSEISCLKKDKPCEGG